MTKQWDLILSIQKPSSSTLPVLFSSSFSWPRVKGLTWTQHSHTRVRHYVAGLHTKRGRCISTDVIERTHTHTHTHSLTHQIGHMHDAGDFATWGGRLAGRAHGVVDGDGDP